MIDGQPTMVGFRPEAEGAWRAFAAAWAARSEFDLELKTYREQTYALFGERLERASAELVRQAAAKVRQLEAPFESYETTDRRARALDDAVDAARQDVTRQLGETGVPPPAPAVRAVDFARILDPSHHRDRFAFKTPRDAEGWQKLVDAKRYYRAAEAYVAARSTLQAERRSVLAIADLGIQAADVSYVDGDAAAGDGFLDAASALIDSVYEVANDAVTWIRHTRAANAIAGFYHELFKFPAVPTLGNEGAFYAGQMVAAGVALVGDIAVMTAGMTLVAGGGGLAIASDGVAAVVAAPAIAEGLGLMAAGGVTWSLHIDEFREAREQYMLAKGGPGPVQAGQTGEAAVRAVEDIGPKTPITMPNGRVRIPDGMTEEVLTEVKNVRYQALTQQLRDYAAYARAHGLRFNLWVQRGARLSKRLLEARERGEVNILAIP